MKETPKKYNPYFGQIHANEKNLISLIAQSTRALIFQWFSQQWRLED